MLPLFFRKRASLKQVPISEGWEEIGEKGPAVEIEKIESPIDVVETPIVVVETPIEQVESPIDEAPIDVLESPIDETPIVMVESLVDVIEHNDESSVDLKESATIELAPIEMSSHDAIEVFDFVQTMTDEDDDEAVLVEDFDLNYKFVELFAKAQRLEAELGRLEKICKSCPVCTGKPAIVIDVSRALDLMRDIFTTGMQYQQRVVSRVCDELCHFADE